MATGWKKLAPDHQTNYQQTETNIQQECCYNVTLQAKIKEWLEGVLKEYTAYCAEYTVNV